MKKAVVFGLLAALLAAPPVFAAEGGKKAQQTQKSKKPKTAQSARKFSKGAHVESRTRCSTGHMEGWDGFVVGYNQADKTYSVRVTGVFACLFKLNPTECTDYRKLTGGSSGQTLSVPGKCLRSVQERQEEERRRTDW